MPYKRYLYLIFGLSLTGGMEIKGEEPHQKDGEMMVELQWKHNIPGVSPADMNIGEMVGQMIPKSCFDGPPQSKDAKESPIWNPTLSEAELRHYKRAAQWAAASYCSQSSLLGWNCGPRCSGKIQ